MKKTWSFLLWASPIPIVMAVFLSSLGWLRDQEDTVAILIAAAVAVFVMAWAIVLAKRMEGGMDEVQRAGQHYAYKQGAVGGSIATVLLLIPPPLVNWYTDTLNVITTGSTETSDRGTVIIAIVFGFMLLTIMQTLGNFVAQAIWSARLNRPR